MLAAIGHCLALSACQSKEASDSAFRCRNRPAKPLTKTHVLDALARHGVHLRAAMSSATCGEPDRYGEATVLSSRGTICGLSEGNR
jgi:hypothetical protein